jgi:hypothetical protein
VSPRNRLPYRARNGHAHGSTDGRRSCPRLGAMTPHVQTWFTSGPRSEELTRLRHPLAQSVDPSHYLGKLFLDIQYLLSQCLQLVVVWPTDDEGTASLTGHEQAFADQLLQCSANSEMADAQLVGEVMGAWKSTRVPARVDPGPQFVCDLNIQITGIIELADSHRCRHTSYKTVCPVLSAWRVGPGTITPTRQQRGNLPSWAGM